MTVQDLWALIGILLGIIFALIGTIYWMLREEDRRLSRNIHALRSKVQTVVISLAAHGILVKHDDD